RGRDAGMQECATPAWAAARRGLRRSGGAWLGLGWGPAGQAVDGVHLPGSDRPDQVTLAREETAAAVGVALSEP
ncbi:MAG: hypothetical protein OEY14_04135, partial [Myxococcales bacterium]|nr:hypothetical protein [Myxococcales bacterium]